MYQGGRLVVEWSNPGLVGRTLHHFPRTADESSFTGTIVVFGLQFPPNRCTRCYFLPLCASVRAVCVLVRSILCIVVTLCGPVACCKVRNDNDTLCVYVCRPYV